MSAWSSPPTQEPSAWWSRRRAPTASQIGHFASHHLISDYVHLGNLAERNRLRIAQIGVVRVVLVRATELPDLQAYTGIALP